MLDTEKNNPKVAAVLRRGAKVQPGYCYTHGRIGKFITRTWTENELAFTVFGLFLVLGFGLRQALWVPWIVESFGKGDDLIVGSAFLTLLGVALAGSVTMWILMSFNWKGFKSWRKMSLGLLASEHQLASMSLQQILTAAEDRRVKKAAVRQFGILEALCDQEARTTTNILRINNASLGCPSQLSLEALTVLKNKRAELVQEVLDITDRLQRTAAVEVENSHQRTANKALMEDFAKGREEKRLADAIDAEFLEGRLIEAKATQGYARLRD